LIVRPARWAACAAAAAVLVAWPSDAAARYVGNLNLFAGQKWLNTGDWEPADQQPELGLMLAFGEERSSVHFSIDAFYSKDDESGSVPPTDSIVSAWSKEFSIGVRKVWDRSVTRPQIGAGATVISVHEDRDGPSGPVSNQAHNYGVWVDAGISWRLARHLNLGIDARYSGARVALGEGLARRDVLAGGVHLGLLLGYGW
jgi:hypothetical protein